MEKPNPFDPPSSTQRKISGNSRSVSVAVSSIVGGAIGLVIGGIAIAVLVMATGGIPGIAEITIWLVLIAILLVLPGAVTGAIIGLGINSQKKQGDQ